jgi:hypothetical protein
MHLCSTPFINLQAVFDIVVKEHAARSLAVESARVALAFNTKSRVEPTSEVFTTSFIVVFLWTQYGFTKVFRAFEHRCNLFALPFCAVFAFAFALAV